MKKPRRETILNCVQPLYKLCSVYLYYSVNKDSNWYISLENGWTLSSKVEDMHAYDPAILFLGLHPIQMQAHVYKEICVMMFKQCGFQ